MQTRATKYTVECEKNDVNCSESSTKKEARKKYQRDWAKKKRQQIKECPEKYEEHNRNERERWKRRMHNLGKENEEFKENRRVYMKNYRARVKEARKQTNTYSNDCSGIKTISRQKIAGRKQILRNRSKTVRELQRVRNESNELKKRCTILQRKIWRLKKKQEKNNVDSKNPQKIVNKILKNKFVNRDLKKRLIIGEALKLEMKHSLLNLRSRKTKNNFYNVFQGTVLHKHKLLGECKEFLSIKSMRKFRQGYKLNETVTRNNRMQVLKNSVKTFFVRDDNSYIAPGKNATITRNKVKMQKRYMSDTLKELYKKYQNETASKISYAAFCKQRPFYVIPPNVASRETCLCITHENMKLITTALFFNNIISMKVPRIAIEKICCNANSTVCLLRKCTKCKNNKITYSNYNEDKIVQRKMWITEKINRISGKTNNPIVVQRTVKKVITESVKVCLQVFEATLIKFMAHTARISHQYRTIQDLRERISAKDMMLHIDFAENYSCKYGREPQSVHFGASREQITLHTGVVYTRNKTKSFCTISESLKHDSAAIVAHLIPILYKYLEENSKIKNLHFVSDSPTTQYRNKNTFYLLSTYLPKYFEQIESITYNFTEPGHGKSAADGIGSIIKRTADTAVAHGTDISNLNNLIETLELKLRNVFIKVVTSEDIDEINKIPCNHVQTFKGTMSVRQWTWKKENDKVIHFNSLSCYDCPRGEKCVHYNVGNPWCIKESNKNNKKVGFKQIKESVKAKKVDPKCHRNKKRQRVK